MTTRKKRSDSTEAKVAALQAAHNDIVACLQPPAHINLRKGDIPFWESIIKARPRDDWNDSDLEVAANLARTKADIEFYQARLDIEGPILHTDKGTPVSNPIFAALDSLTRRALSLARALHVHAEATVGSSSHQGKRAAEKKAADKIAESGSKLRLIPKLQGNA